MKVILFGLHIKNIIATKLMLRMFANKMSIKTKVSANIYQINIKATLIKNTITNTGIATQ